MSEPTFIATAQGADDVIRRGNRRRRITAFTSLTAAATVTTVLVLAPWSGVGGRESLTPSDGGTFWPTATATASPSPTKTPAPPVAASAARSALTSSSATGSPGSRPGGSPTTPASPTRRTSPRQSPITRGTGSIGGQDLCQDDQTDAAQGWCIRYTGPSTARRGHPVTLSVELCRLGTFPAASVTFGSTREVALDVADWEAGQGITYTSPGRTATLAPTQCLTWSSTWDTRDRDGFLVLPGSYSVGFGVDAGGQVAFARSGADLRVTD